MPPVVAGCDAPHGDVAGAVLAPNKLGAELAPNRLGLELAPNRLGLELAPNRPGEEAAAPNPAVAGLAALAKLKAGALPAAG
jgi:hypothetical protein